MSVIHTILSSFETYKSCPLSCPKNRDVRYKPFAINRFYYKDLAVVPSVLAKSVCCIEVFTVKGVRYAEIPLHKKPLHGKYLGEQLSRMVRDWE